MDTLFILLNDTISTAIVKLIDSCQPCIQGTPTNCNDLGIANSICHHLYCIVFVCVTGFLLWKIIELIAKGFSGLAIHCWKKEESKRKNKIDLTERLLDFLKSKATEKNDNNGQQSNNKSLSWTAEDIDKLLKENAASSCSEKLRKKYKELCVEILNILKTGKQGNGKPSQDALELSTPPLNPQNDGNSNGEAGQSGNTGSGMPDNQSVSNNTSKIYTNVLCTLIGLIQKDQLEDKDIQELMKICELKS